MVYSLVISEIAQISRLKIRGRPSSVVDSRGCRRMAAVFGIDVGNTSACLALFKVFCLFDGVL
jgi:hypothetical protein